MIGATIKIPPIMYYIFNIPLQVDDDKQTISLSMSHYYYWYDTRVIANKSHFYWNNQEDAYKLSLDGTFVEKCLWVPKLAYVNVVGLSSWRPTPTQSEGPPMEVYLSRDGRIEVMVHSFHVTLSCQMDFSRYPFDTQVNQIGESGVIINQFNVNKLL